MKPKRVALFSTWQWITIIGSVITTGLTVTAFAFTTFEQKSDIKDTLKEINVRLASIEQALRK